MTDEHLRSLLASIDPVPDEVTVDAADSPRARALTEEIMSTPVLDQPTRTGRPAGSAGPRRPWRPAVAIVAAAAAVAVAVVAFAVVGGDDDAPTRSALSLPDPGVMTSCIAFDVTFLADMPVAFAGTVTAVTDTTVTVDVDRWYRSTDGSADLVDLTMPAATTSASLDGVDFVVGQRYLVTAAEGNVNGCGFSGPATPELEAAFEQAFG